MAFNVFPSLNLPRYFGEARNEYRSGHGKNGRFRGLQPRDAKLAVGAASTFAIYLTHSELK